MTYVTREELRAVLEAIVSFDYADQQPVEYEDIRRGLHALHDLGSDSGEGAGNRGAGSSSRDGTPAVAQANVLSAVAAPSPSHPALSAWRDEAARIEVGRIAPRGSCLDAYDALVNASETLAAAFESVVRERDAPLPTAREHPFAQVTSDLWCREHTPKDSPCDQTTSGASQDTNGKPDRGASSSAFPNASGAAESPQSETSLTSPEPEWLRDLRNLIPLTVSEMREAVSYIDALQLRAFSAEAKAPSAPPPVEPDRKEPLFIRDIRENLVTGEFPPIFARVFAETGIAYIDSLKRRSAELEAIVKEYRELRPEVLAFARLMEAQLKANDHKPGWKNDCPTELLSRLMDESTELIGELRHSDGHPMLPGDTDRETVGKEAADVGNFAMMIADVCGALLPQSDAGRRRG